MLSFHKYGEIAIHPRYVIFYFRPVFAGVGAHHQIFSDGELFKYLAPLGNIGDAHPDDFFGIPAIDAASQRVTGTVRLKLYKGNVIITGRKSPNSLYDQDVVTFEEDSVYDQRDAEGFIKLNALRLRLAGKNKA